MIHFIEDSNIREQMERAEENMKVYGERLLTWPEQRRFDDYLEEKTRFELFQAFLNLETEEKRQEAIRFGCKKLFENNLPEPYRRGFKDALTTICNKWDITAILEELIQ